MRNTILLSALMFLSLLMQAQELTQTIRGTVYDEQSQSPLFGVNVVVFALTQEGSIAQQKMEFFSAVQ